MRFQILTIIVMVAGLFHSCSPTRNGEQPNIVVINVDDLGWKDLGYTGSNYYETPIIDRLSASGMIFTDGYAAAANCAPSRASLMTGKWTPRHGIYTVASSERGSSRHRRLIPVQNTTTLRPDLPVLPGILNQNGYSTCHAGKWHLSESPLDYGFELNIGGGHNGHPSSYYPPYGNVHLDKEGDEYLTDAIMERAVHFLDTVGQPFFLYYAPYAVHTPIQPVRDLLPKYEEKPEWEGQKNPEYASMIENLDRNIKRLVASLENRDILLNTVIVFTSDNGGLYGITMQKPLRAGKGSYYEGGIRVPLFFSWPGKIRPGSSSEYPVNNLDLFPTLLSIAGIDPAPYDPDGANLLPVLLEKEDLAERPLFWHFPVYLQAYNVHQNENRDSLFRTRPGSVIRMGKWKLHYYFEDAGVELYDLEEDISEARNLADEMPEKSAELMNRLEEWWETTGAPVPDQPNPEYQME